MTQKVYEPFLIRFPARTIPSSHAIHTKLFGHKHRSHENARIGLIGNDKLHFMLMLIAVHSLLRVTLDTPRRQHVHPQRYGLQSVRHHTVDTEYSTTDSKLRILRHSGNIRKGMIYRVPHRPVTSFDFHMSKD
jgi:hypothetical protein